MQRGPLILVLIVFLIFAFVIGFFSIRFLSKVSVKGINKPKENIEKSIEPPQQRISIVYANINIQERTIINETMITLKEILLKDKPADAITTQNMIIGKINKNDIPSGVPILSSDLFETEKLSSTIPKSRRGITIEVNDHSSVSGLIKPGDFVDVVGTFSKNVEGIASDAKVFSKIIIQNSEVLAIGKTYYTEIPPPGEKAKPQEPFTLATLAVSPNEVEKLVLAENKGKLSLALRSSKEFRDVRTPGMSQARLLNQPEKQKTSKGNVKYPAYQPIHGKIVEVYKGSNKELVGVK